MRARVTLSKYQYWGGEVIESPWPIVGARRVVSGARLSLDRALALGSSPSAALSPQAATPGDIGASVSLPTVTLPQAKRLTPESAAAFSLSPL